MSENRQMEEPDANIADELDDNGFVLNNFFFPEEVLSYLLSFVTPHCLVFQCRLVCKAWKRIIDEPNMWKHKVKRTKTQSLSKLSNTDKKKLNLPWFVYFTIFTKDPFEKNFLWKNNCGQKKLDCWSVVLPSRRKERGSGMWNIESVPSGSDPLPNSEDFGNNTCCFVTSYNLCEKTQTIDLNKVGISKHIMDEIQPTIVISEWYAGRYDCGCKYKLTGYLLDERQQILVEKEEERCVQQWVGKEWNKVTITFENYGLGVKYIKFAHQGKDTKFWAGNYGSKMSGAVVMVSLPFKG